MAAVPAAEPAVQALAAVDAQVVTSLELTERNVEEPTQAEITAVLDTKTDALEKLGELETSEPELWTREQKLLVETVNEEIQALNQSRIEAVTFAGVDGGISGGAGDGDDAAVYGVARQAERGNRP